MGWVNGITFGIAVLGAVLGVFNTVTNYRRGAVRLRVVPRIKNREDGSLAFHVDLVNAGRIPVRIEKVFLAGGRGNAAVLSDRLCDEVGWPRLPCLIEPLRKLAIGPVQTRTLQAVAQEQPITVVAQTEDGRVVKARCNCLRQIYAQLQATSGKRP